MAYLPDDERRSRTLNLAVAELQGFVNATEDFQDHAAVLDGASNLFVEVFGELGVHARSVLGANSLKGGLPVILRAVIGTKN
jgi:hypothetical protein